MGFNNRVKSKNSGRLNSGLQPFNQKKPEYRFILKFNKKPSKVISEGFYIFFLIDQKSNSLAASLSKYQIKSSEVGFTKEAGYFS